MKINGEPLREIKNSFAHFMIYRVKLKDGPMDKTLSIVGNSTILFQQGHRYELNSEGDFVYSPSGQN